MTPLLIIFLIILVLLGMPLFTAIAGLTIVLYYFVGNIDISIIMEEMYRIANAPMVITLPLFTLAGYLLAQSKAPVRLVKLTQSIFGWVPSGLSLVVLTACATFTALSGVSGVTIIALGGLLLPALLKDKYSQKYSLGLITCCGSLGLLFPPSLPLIVYGIIAQTSIEKLFIAGILPGILIIFLFYLYSIIAAPREEKQDIEFSFSNIFDALRDAVWEIPIPAIVILGVYCGILTVPETATVTIFYIIIVEIFIKKDIKFKDIPRIFKEGILVISGILIILCTALGFTNFLVDQRVPMKMFEIVSHFIQSKFAFLLILNIFLIIVGCLMDIFTATMVVVPIIYPIAISYGIDPIHLGIVFLVNLEIGYLTPPVGINLFISSFYFQKPVVEIYKTVIPFIIVLIISLLIITYFPQLSTSLVKFSAIEY